MGEVVDLKYIHGAHCDIRETQTDTTKEEKISNTALMTKDPISTVETYWNVDGSALPGLILGADQLILTGRRYTGRNVFISKRDD